MAFLTDTFIIEALGYSGAAKYDALTGTGAEGTATKAQYIGLADSVVVAAAQKGGYSSLSASSPPSSGDALNIVRQMAFVVWFRYSDWPRPSWLYLAADDERRVDLPGMTRDALSGPDGARITNGTDSSGVALTPVFTLSSWNYP
jgi:hypothetical protein